MIEMTSVYAKGSTYLKIMVQKKFCSQICFYALLYHRK